MMRILWAIQKQKRIKLDVQECNALLANEVMQMRVMSDEGLLNKYDFFVILQSVTGAAQAKGLRTVSRLLASRIDQEADIGVALYVPIFSGVAWCN